ncbi:glycosyltransferase family 4 protein [Leifsonia bigeumensis]|uniref:Glycosyltransferase family 4 protein n=1 Tax=Leifsonella bigeumensis TaxID=433643 RepID=A0ABP7FB94_9MICO
MASTRSIVLGVTADTSLMLMRGFPEFLRDAGWEVHVVSSPGPLLDALDKVEDLHTHGLAMARQPSPLTDMRGLFAWVRLLRDIRPTVTLVGTPKAGLLGGLASTLVRTPRRVYLLRGLRLETATGIQRVVLTALERLAMRCATDIVAVSASLRQRAIDLRLVAQHRILVLGSGSSNGVDLAAADKVDPGRVAELRKEMGIGDGTPVIGFVGRLTKDKGIDVLVEAMRLLVERGVRHRLLVIGSVDDAQSSELLASLRGSRNPPLETGHVTDPGPYYRLMDLLCLPTLREGFPNVVLEAAAAGVPTVTTDATGARDSVIDGITGLISRTGDPTSLADRLAELLTATPAERRRMGARARSRAQGEFSRPLVWTNLEAYLRNRSDAVASGA